MSEEFAARTDGKLREVPSGVFGSEIELLTVLLDILGSSKDGEGAFPPIGFGEDRLGVRARRVVEPQPTVEATVSESLNLRLWVAYAV